MSAVRNVITGTATKYLLLVVNIAIGIVLMPFTIHHLGTEEYGLWMLAASLTYYFQLLDLGYGTGLVRHVSDADARGDIAGVNRVLSTFFVVFAGLGLIAAAGIAFLVLWVIPRFPNLSDDQVWRGQAVLAMLGMRIAIGLPMTVFGAATTARQHFALNNGVAIVIALTNALITYVVLAAGYGLITLVAATTSVSIASYGAYMWTAKRAMPELRIRVRSFSRPLVKDVTAFSVYLFIISVSAQIGFNLDNLVVGAALGTSAVAIYAIAFRLADYQRQLCNQFNSLLFPVIVRMGATSAVPAMREMMIDATRISLSLVAVVTICVLSYAAPLIERWMGPGFDSAVVPLYLLAVAGIVLVGQGPLGNVLLGTGRQRLVAFTSLGEALANLTISLVLVRRFGLAGVAFGTMVPVLIANMCVLLPAACRQVEIPTRTFLWRVCRAPLVGAVPAVAVCLILRQWYPVSSLSGILLQCVLIGSAYLVTLVSIGLEPAVRARYIRHIRSVLRPPPAPTRLSEAVS